MLIIICLLTAALLEVFFVIHRTAGGEVRILYDGIELKEIPLYPAQTGSGTKNGGRYYLITYRDDVAGVEDFESRPELPEGINYNMIFVSDDKVVMEAADCKDQICVHHKPISSKGESIICLPHRLVIEVIGDDHTAGSGQNRKDSNSEEMSDEPLDGVVR